MYSVVIDGKVLDFRYKKLQENHYAFYIGDILVGQVFNLKRCWSAVSCEHRGAMTRMQGFKNRYYASEYLLQLNGYEG